MIEAYMQATLDVLRLAGQMFLQRIDYELRRFGEDLLDFINALDRHPRRDWRERFDAFLADQTTRGREITPESRAALITYLEMWEQNVYGGPPQKEPPVEVIITRVAEAAEPLSPPPAVSQFSMLAPRRTAGPKPPARKPAWWRPPTGDRADFYRKVNDARGCIYDLERMLPAITNRIEAAKPDEPFEIDAELTAIDSLIWLHNDLMESAREIWLTKNLGQPEFAELDLSQNPVSLGLPLFTDKLQAERAKAQAKKISERLKQKIAFYDNVIFTMEIIKGAGTVASFLLAGGILYQAARQGAKIFLIKSVAMAASYAASQVVGEATGAALRAVGLEDEQVEHVQNAVELVSMLLLLRKVGQLKGRRPPSQADRQSKSIDRQVGPKQTAPEPVARLTALPAPKARRLPQDINVNSTAPPRLSTARSIGGSRKQWRALQADIRRARAEGARDIRVNQEQVNAAGQRVGINRPDLQYTRADGTRVYIEYDNATPGSFPNTPRGPAHAVRIQANDPSGVILLMRFP